MRTLPPATVQPELPTARYQCCPLHAAYLRVQVDIAVTPGSHSTEAAVNKQLNDKERVAAALENPNLLEMVNNCLASSYR
jgi:hypothetical protein